MKNVTKIIALALIAVMCVAMFASCAPNSDPEKAKEALNDNGYLAVNVPVGDYADYKGLEAVVTGGKLTDLTDAVIIFYFEDSASAKDAFETIESEEMKDAPEDYVCKRSGKMVYAGHKDAISAAR